MEVALALYQRVTLCVGQHATCVTKYVSRNGGGCVPCCKGCKPQNEDQILLSHTVHDYFNILLHPRTNSQSHLHDCLYLNSRHSWQ